MNGILGWRPTEGQQGIGIGVVFCVLTVTNSASATAKAAAVFAMGQPVDGRAVAVLYFTIGATILLHVLMWLVYAALVAGVSRLVLAGGPEAAPFAAIFVTAGTAQLPLVAWAALMAVAWMVWPPDSPQQLVVLSRFQLGTRTVAYLCALIVMTYTVAARYRMTTSGAIVTTWTPALTLWLLSILLAAVGSVATGSQ